MIVLSFLLAAVLASPFVYPLGGDKCGQVAYRGQKPCPLTCPTGYQKKCMWTGCDYRQCSDFGMSVLRNDRPCKNAGYDYTEKMCCTCQACSNSQRVVIMKDGLKLTLQDEELVLADVTAEEAAWELAYNMTYRVFLFMKDGKALEYNRIGLEWGNGTLVMNELSAIYRQQWSITLVDGLYMLGVDFQRLFVKKGKVALGARGKPKGGEKFQIVGLEGKPLCVTKKGPLGYDNLRFSKPDYQVHPDRPDDDCVLYDYKFMRNDTYPRKKVNAANPEECWDKCQADKTVGNLLCKGWTWKEGDNDPCRLFVNTKTAANNTGTMAGRRGCHPTYGKLPAAGTLAGWRVTGNEKKEGKATMKLREFDFMEGSTYFQKK